MTRSVVTGGSGFIGSHVVDVLCDAGHEVVVVDRVPPQHRKDVTFRAADITDLSAVCDAIEGADYVHHIAGVANIHHGLDRPVQCVEANVLGTVHVLEAARCAGVKRVLIASSVQVYTAVQAARAFEDTPLHMPGPGHVHTSSKIAGELIVHDYASLYSLPITVFRYGIPYGPRMHDDSLIPRLLERALSGQALQVAGDGQQVRNLVYVGDLARAHLLALSDTCANQTFNLDGSRAVTVLAVAQAVRKLVGAHLTIEHVAARPGERAGKLVSQEKSTRLLGWSDGIDFDEGMRRTYEWYRATHPAQPLAPMLGVQPGAAG